MNLHLVPYGHVLVKANVRQMRVLYAAGCLRTRMSTYPWANWQRSLYGHAPVCIQLRHSSVLYLSASRCCESGESDPSLPSLPSPSSTGWASL